jgi:hypothetical protein
MSDLGDSRPIFICELCRTVVSSSIGEDDEFDNPKRRDASVEKIEEACEAVSNDVSCDR